MDFVFGGLRRERFWVEVSEAGDVEVEAAGEGAFAFAFPAEVDCSG